MDFLYSKIRSGAKDIVRAHPTDAGIDFFVPDDFNEGKPYRLNPNQSVTIQSGIKVEIPYGYMGIFCNKSGVASKKNIVYGAHVIDSFYAGEVGINLHNIGSLDEYINPGDKIIQMVIVPIAQGTPRCVDENDLYKNLYLTEYRGEKGFGATGDK